MAIKKYINGAWVPTNYRKFGTETNTITSLPAQIIGDGQLITSCQISGNTIQNGTPTPEAPVNVQGCGERTGNLFNDFQIINKVPRIANGELINYSGQDGTGAACTEFIPIQNGDMTLKSYSGGFSIFIFLYDADKNYIGNVGYENTKHDIVSSASIAGSQNARFMRVRTDSYAMYTANTKLMLNAGSTPLLYEPYGYKLPPTVNGTEYPIYLGQVETTRRIRKLVLTGEEDWEKSSSTGAYYCSDAQFGATYLHRKSLTTVCTHYKSVINAVNTSGLSNGEMCLFTNTPDTSLGIQEVYVKDNNIVDAAAFKAYLAAQYAADTPVTIWYVLANEETGIVNEPLMKIGDYADTVEAANIPTTGTAENFDVGTTLKPSEVSLTYHGWHEHTDTKYTQGE